MSDGCGSSVLRVCQPAHPTTLIHFGASLPAKVLADLLNLHPNTAVRWVKAAGGDWTSYAASRLREVDAR